jgi:hypothetical protein
MPAFCAFYSMTPQQFRQLRVGDFRALSEFMRKTLKPKR